MAINRTLLTQGSGSGAGALTATISPSADKLVLLWVRANKSGGADFISAGPTHNSGGLTFVRVGGILSGTSNIELFRAMSSTPGTGNIGWDYPALQAAIRWIVVEYDDLVTTGLHGADAIAQFKTGAGSSTTPGATFDNSFGSIENGVAAGVSVPNSTTITQGSGYTLGDSNGGFLADEWRADNDTTPDFSLAASRDWSFIAAELVKIPSPTLFIPKITVM